jgi:FSR family fosmidomycin resistance protein-like MFS transporter
MLIAGVAGQIIGATMSDKYGRKEYIMFGMITAIPPFFLFLATEGIVSVIAMFAFGYFLWSTFSVTVAMSHELVPGGTGTVSGLMLGFAVGAGGAGVAVTGYIADLTSAQTAFTLLIVPIIVALILFALLPYPWKLLKKDKLTESTVN